MAWLRRRAHKFKRLRRSDPATGRVEAARSRVAEAVRDLGLDGALPHLNYVEAVERWAEGRTLGR